MMIRIFEVIKIDAEQGHIQKFFRRWGFVWTGKFRGVLGLFLKNPQQIEKLFKKGRGFDPKNPFLNTPLILKTI